MAKKRKKAPATRSTSARSTPRKRKYVKRRKTSGGLSGGMKGIGQGLKNMGAGAVGGGAYALVSNFAGGNPWIKLLIGAGLSFGAGYMNMPNVSAGVSGAVGSEITKNLFGLSDDMEETEFVPDNVGVDEDGNVFALSEGGEPMDYLGNLQEDPELMDAFDLSEDEQSVMMVPTYM